MGGKGFEGRAEERREMGEEEKSLTLFECFKTSPKKKNGLRRALKGFKIPPNTSHF